MLEDEARKEADKPSGRAAARVLAERYERGEDVMRDLAKAVSWYRAAALVLSQSRYVYMPGFAKVAGSVIAVGGGGPVLPGDAIAMQNLGRLYLAGQGVPANSERGFALLTCAKKLDPLSSETTEEPAI